MKKNIFLVAVLGVALALGMVIVGCKNDPSCDDENNCSAANNAYYCGRSGCAANTGSRCGC
ncbi:hypothetical protein FACS1894137_03120 [Spirochaetia bacterium]|nr:hypothetical protein FACS1894137_03120 [Spirochaetia bacterium]